MKKSLILSSMLAFTLLSACQSTSVPAPTACKQWPQSNCYIDSTNVDAIILNSDINAQNHEGLTPLMVARDAASVRSLITAKADVNLPSFDGKTAIFFANHDTIDLLIAAGADLDVQVGPEVTALMLAIVHQDLDVVQKLIAGKADLTKRDINGYTALHYATSIHQNLIEGDQQKVIQNVIDLTDPNPYTVHTKDHVVNPNNTYDAKVVYRTLNADLVTALIAGGADVNATDSRGRSPIFFALDPKITSALIAAGADAQLKDNDGITPSQVIQATDYHLPDGNQAILDVLSAAPKTEKK